jgi:hypothetical protein
MDDWIKQWYIKEEQKRRLEEWYMFHECDNGITKQKGIKT